jgi:hypothetical protein
VVPLTVLLILKVTVAVLWGYRAYFPPDFQSDFLRGRESYFFGSYRTAFHLHLASGPLSLVLGMLLISQRFRAKFPEWHRSLGRVQGLNVLLLVAPSGLWMAWYASTGPVAGAGFAGHVHVHVVPRWEADSNFMAVTADTRVLPQSLEDAFVALRRAFGD